MHRWICIGTCKRGWTIQDLQSCPACGSAIEYLGTILKPIVTAEEDFFKRMVEDMKVTRLPEATRSDMQQNVYYAASKKGVTVNELKKERMEKQKVSKAEQTEIFIDCGHKLASRGHYIGKETGNIEYHIYYCKRCKSRKAFREAIVALARIS